jgi:beta-glucosidase/6-phospho-beta-glucosidase/beta-galactosidase
VIRTCSEFNRRHYADLAFKSFGDRVKTWITFNEPQLICDLGYNIGVHAPGLVSRAAAASAGGAAGWCPSSSTQKCCPLPHSGP